jgi:CRISPR-associated protein Csb1
LRKAVQTGAAARSRVALQPAGGEGTKIFPPTYAGAVYATEKRRLPAYKDPVECVLLDSVQSQANRLEEALQQAIDNGRFKNAGISLPLVEVDFTSFWGDEKTKKHPIKRDTNLTDDLRLLEPVGKVTSLQAPHRIVDAILRDSVVVEYNKPFRAKAEKDESRYGQRLRRVTAQNATALFELCPTALLLGMWDSTGPKGGLGAKFERAMVSEVVGINAQPGVKTSSRIDPLAIQKDAGPLYRRTGGGFTVDPAEAITESVEGVPTGKVVLFKKNNKNQDVFHEPGLFRKSDGGWTWSWEEANEEKDRANRPTGKRLLYHKDGTKDVYVERPNTSFADQGRPSEANHGNVTPGIDYRRDQNRNLIKDEDGRPIPVGGYTVTSAEQTIVLSFPALRRLRFPINERKNGVTEEETNNAARTVLAALGLCAAALAAEAGLDLRSRCLLWPINPLSWELLGKPGVKEEGITLEADDAIKLLKDAIDAAKAIGLPWREQPLQLVPSDGLVKLVAKSQHLAQLQGGEGGE